MTVGYPDWGAGAPSSSGIEVLQFSGQHIAPLGNFSTTFPITRQAFELYLQLRNATTGAVKTPVLLEMLWQDAANAFTVGYKRKWIFSGDSTGSHVLLGRGPSQGSKCTLTLTNFLGGTPTVIASGVVLDTARPYTIDETQTLDNLAPVYPGYTAVPSDLPSGLLAAVNGVVVPINSSVTYLLPFYEGKIAVKQFGNGPNGIALLVNNDAEQGAGLNNQVYQQVSAAGVSAYGRGSLPPEQCALQVQNTSTTATSTVFVMVTTYR